MRKLVVYLAAVSVALSGCAVSTGPSRPEGPVSRPAGSPSGPASSGGPVDQRYVQRLQAALPPLLAVMDRPKRPDEVKVGIMDDPSINAGNAGGGQFLVTRGLLERANDDQLLAILAHEAAHEDLGHVAKAQALGAGINIAGMLLGNLFPGTGPIVPIAGTLVSRAYGRSEEHAADTHAVTLLRRMDRPNAAQLMIGALQWIQQQAGGSTGGGFLSTHPGTDERIDRLQRLAAANRP